MREMCSGLNARVKSGLAFPEKQIAGGIEIEHQQQQAAQANEKTAPRRAEGRPAVFMKPMSNLTFFLVLTHHEKRRGKGRARRQESIGECSIVCGQAGQLNREEW